MKGDAVPTDLLLPASWAVSPGLDFAYFSEGTGITSKPGVRECGRLYYSAVARNGLIQR